MATHSCLEARFPIHNSAEGQTPQGGPANPSPQTEIPMGNCGGWAPRKRDPGSGEGSKGGRPPPASLGTSKPGRAGTWREPVWTRHPASGAPAPVVAVEVVQPAAFLDKLDGARAVAPGGVAVQPLVLLALAALQAALVGALQLPVGVVVDALPRLGLPAPGTCSRERELLLSRPGPWGGGGGAGSDWQPGAQGGLRQHGGSGVPPCTAAGALDPRHVRIAVCVRVGREGDARHVYSWAQPRPLQLERGPDLCF